ncbi:Prefoldin subunit 5 [Halotydeus destructor]|nr:Prefoldin subunit 5 [Halotydeus destructor]
MANQGKTQINIGDMSIPQLASVKQQLDSEVELLTNSVQSLQNARNKFQESFDCIEKQKSVKDGNEVLVPLTGSMYVPGLIVNPDKFVVDIGTGYYVEKDNTSAADFFKRKVTFVQEQMDKYVKIAQEKANLRDNIMEAIQYKQMALAQSQQQQQQATGK